MARSSWRRRGSRLCQHPQMDHREFGARQSRVYRDTLVQAIGELADGPNVAGSTARDEIMAGLRTLHVARRGRRGSHFLMYRAANSTIEIVRILHDRMDLRRHVRSAPRREHRIDLQHSSERQRASGCAGVFWRRPVSGAPRPMKMGTTRSPWHYDAAIRNFL